MGYPQIIWTNAEAQELDLTPSGDEPRIVINRLEGLGEVLVDFQTIKAPFQDGATWLDSPLEARDVRIKLNLFASSRLEMASLRDEVIRAFNPKLGPGVFSYQAAEAAAVRLLVAHPDGVPIFVSEAPEMGAQEVEIPLRAPNPHWVANSEKSKTIPTNGNDTPNNGGHVNCPVRIEIVGPATNPKISNTTEDADTYIEWEGEVAAGDTLVITTGFQDKTVELEGVNVIGDITLLSTFWWLFAGVNTVAFEATGTTGDTKCDVYWTERHVGI